MLKSAVEARKKGVKVEMDLKAEIEKKNNEADKMKEKHARRVAILEKQAEQQAAIQAELSAIDEE